MSYTQGVRKHVKLYGLPLSPFVRMIMHVCELAGDTLELLERSPMDGSLKTPEFLKLNPFGQMPAVEVDDMAIFDSQAITRYLATGTALYPVHRPRDMARVEMGIATGLTVYESIKPLFYKCVIGPMRGEPKPDDLTPMQTTAKERLRQLETSPMLQREGGDGGGGNFLWGFPRETLGDVVLYTLCQQVLQFDLLPLGDEFPNFSRWHAAMAATPAAKRMDALVRVTQAKLAGKDADPADAALAAQVGSGEPRAAPGSTTGDGERTLYGGVGAAGDWRRGYGAHSFLPPPPPPPEYWVPPPPRFVEYPPVYVPGYYDRPLRRYY